MMTTWWPHGRYWSTCTPLCLLRSCYIWLQEWELCLLVKITELWFLLSDWLTWSVPTKHWTYLYSSSWGMAMDIISLTSQIVFWDTTVGEHFQKQCSQATFWGTRSICENEATFPPVSYPQSLHGTIYLPLTCHHRSLRQWRYVHCL